MEITGSDRVQKLPHYAFAQMDELLEKLKNSGVVPIDFGVGDPTVPTPEKVRRQCAGAIDRHASAGYPSYIGSASFRQAAAGWIKKRFGVELDPETQVTATIGSKEAVFHFPLALVNPGDVVLCPSPGYPPYNRGCDFAGGQPCLYPVHEKDDFLPPLHAIPAEKAGAAKLMWICYPNAPTGRVAGSGEFKAMVEWARENEIVIASDEAYIDLWFSEKPPRSILCETTKNVIAFFSLSKRSAMTGYRVGFAAGDPGLISLLRKVKTNLDSGVPWFIEDAALTALEDESHVADMRRMYNRKKDILIKGLTASGLPRCEPDGTIYIWQKLPDGYSAQQGARHLLDPDVAVVAMPGNLLSEPLEDGYNPGEGFLRFALCPPIEQVEEAAARIAEIKW